MKFKFFLFIAFVLSLNLQGQDTPCGSVFNDTFDEAGALPVEWIEYNTSGQVTVEDGRLKFDYTQALPSAYRSFDAINKSFSYSFDVESTRNYVVAKMHLMSSSGKYLTSIIFGNNGTKNIQYATALDGSNLPTSYSGGLLDVNYDKNITYSVSLAVDFENKTVDFYLNGELKVEDIAFLEDAEDFAKIDINHIAMYSNEGRFFFDNISLIQEDVDRLGLKSAVALAVSTKDNAVVGDSYGKYLQEAVNQFEAEIIIAKAVSEECSATQTQIDEALVSLNAAQAVFEDSQISDPVLKLYAGTDLSGEMQEVYCGYYNGTLGDFDDKAVSFTLDKGYMATFAQNVNGTGVSKVYVASEENLAINLPVDLQQSVSFIRVSPWRSVKKKGIGAKGEDVVDAFDCAWSCNWSNTGEATEDVEFVPNQWGGGSVGGSIALGERMDITHHMAFNEPDNDDQSNMTVDKAIEKYELLLASGLRLGSPANTDGAKGAAWRNEFMEKAEAKGYRVDFMVVHYYKKTTPANFYNWLKAIYDKWQRPIWIKEFNYGAPWVNNAPTTNQAASNGLQGYINMLDTANIVERYAIFTWQPDKPVYSLMSNRTPIELSTSGIMYRDHESPVSYAQSEYEQAIPLGVTSNQLSSEAFVYPTLVKDGLINVGFSENINTQDLKVSIYNLCGHKVIQLSGAPAAIDVTALNKGIYIVEMDSGKGVSKQKIIMQ